MVRQNVVVKNPSGLHLRPASLMTQIASKCKSKITITDGKKLVNPKSILSLMSAGIQRGTDVEVICEGDSEQEDLQTIIAAIESGLGEL